MGKYMRKSKTTGEVSLLEVTSSTSPLGVRTRAKTLALQKSNSTAGVAGDGGGSYLQLRSRRLEKQGGRVVKRQKHPSLKDPNLPNSGSVRKVLEEVKDRLAEEKNHKDSFQGENLLEFEARERTTRESTPCSLIRDPDNIQTPGSSTRPPVASQLNGRVPSSARRNIPTAPEMNDFFAGAEEQQQREFIEKYNFDPVNDKPLPGRYEWVKVNR